MAEPIQDKRLEEKVSQKNSDSLEASPKKEKNSSPSRALWLFTLFLITVGLVWVAYWFFYLQFHESTDDAYASGNFVSINPVISGTAIAYYADDTDLVAKGQLLVQIDPTNYQAIYDKELATLAQVTLRVRELFNNVQTQRDSVKYQRALLERSEYDYKSRLKLKTTTPAAVAEEDFIHAEKDFIAAQFNVQQAESRLAAALAATGNTPPENHPLILQQRAAVLTAYYNLSHCKIYAPQTGYIAQRTVDPGEWITPTTNLMALIPADQFWVDANFKETQLKKMRVGQPATVWFDLYGSKILYHGHVIGIASGTGSIFSLIPPQNATGNWIKIVQRLPVRISLDRETVEKFPVRLGISAEVDVNVSNQDLPFLQTTPSQNPVEQTPVFDIDIGKLEELMDKIVRDNLQADQNENK